MEVIAGIFSLLSCSRRQRPEPCLQEGISKLHTVPASDSEQSTVHSTEAGDASNAELSDHSLASDSEVPVLSPSLRPLGPPPGLSLLSETPGLHAAPKLKLATETRLRSQAPLFVPGFGTAQTSSKPMRQTISLAMGMLEELGTTAQAGDAYHQQQQPSDTQAFSGLQDAISKLTPEDAGMLRSFLEAKDAQRNATPFAGDAMLPSFPAHAYAGHSEWNEPISGMPGSLAAALPFSPGLVCANALSAGHMPPPPGTFFHNQGCWMPVAAASEHSACPYTRFGAKQRGSTKAKRKDALKDNAQSQSTNDDPKETLRTNLRDLSFVDSARVIMVRKINRLGLESPRLLESYFSKFGTVERCMISHSRAKSIFGHGTARVRPAGLGFLVMASATEVESIMAAGREHEIEGAIISTHAFETRELDAAEVKDGDAQAR